MLENIKLTYTTQNHSSVTILKHFLLMGVEHNCEYKLPSMIQIRDKQFYTINFKTSLKVHKIIQAL